MEEIMLEYMNETEDIEKDCNNCVNATDDFNNDIDNGCYMCCKGLENNYVPIK